MDSFIGLAKQGFEKYEQSQNKSSGNDYDSEVRKTGGAEYNAPDHSSGGRPPASAVPDLDDDHVVSTAAAHGSGESDLFSQGLSFLRSQTGEHAAAPPVDERKVQDAHEQAYGQGNSKSLDASSLGSAAALQALKNFTGGGGSSAPSGNSSSGGGMQSKLIGMAMAEASKLFDSQGGASSGNKQDAVNGAAATVMKLLIQSKLSGTVGGGNSGGLGSLVGLAGKFL